MIMGTNHMWAYIFVGKCHSIALFDHLVQQCWIILLHLQHSLFGEDFGVGNWASESLKRNWSCRSLPVIFQAKHRTEVALIIHVHDLYLDLDWGSTSLLVQVDLSVIFDHIVRTGS